MTPSTETELKELKEFITRQFEQTNSKIDKLQDDVTDLKGSVSKLEGEFKRVEEKLEAKIDGLDTRRLKNEKIISRAAFIDRVVGVLVGLIKFLFFPSNP